MCVSVVFWSEDRKENINNVERLIKNFREPEKKLKATRKRVKRLEEMAEKYQEAKRVMKGMKKRIQLLETKLRTLEKKEKNYKLVWVYPTKGKCRNK